jgi:hypothetical protein
MRGLLNDGSRGADVDGCVVGKLLCCRPRYRSLDIVVRLKRQKEQNGVQFPRSQGLLHRPLNV